jgi:murein DD-endopeptidase MepM/ murein hydrolase activator NlpD
MSDEARDVAAGMLIRRSAPWLAAILGHLLVFAWPLMIVIAFAASWSEETLCDGDGGGIEIDVISPVLASDEAQQVREIIAVGVDEPALAQQVVVLIAFAHQETARLVDDPRLVGPFGLDDTWGSVELRRSTRQAAQRLYEAITELPAIPADATPASVAILVLGHVDPETLNALEEGAANFWQLVTMGDSGELAGCGVAGFSLNSDGPLNMPVLGVITSHPGPRDCFVDGVWEPGGHCVHEGLDIGAPCGTPIVAAEAGVVTWADWGEFSGWSVRIKHEALDLRNYEYPEEWDTSYWHQLERPLVKAGQKVARGQIIGYVGETGSADGCHLHLMLTNVARGTRTNDASNYFGNMLKEI